MSDHIHNFSLISYTNIFRVTSSSLYLVYKKFLHPLVTPASVVGHYSRFLVIGCTVNNLLMYSYTTKNPIFTIDFTNYTGILVT